MLEKGLVLSLKVVAAYFIIFCYLAHFIIMIGISQFDLFFLSPHVTDGTTFFYKLFALPLIFCIFLGMYIYLSKTERNDRYKELAKYERGLNTYEKTTLSVLLVLHILITVYNLGVTLILALVSIFLGLIFIVIFSVLAHFGLLILLVLAIQETFNMENILKYFKY